MTFACLVFFPEGMEVRQGWLRDNVEQQLNFLDTFSWALGTHQFRFGIDYRRLSPTGLEGGGYAFSLPISRS
jgi:hypothetical protein